MATLYRKYRPQTFKEAVGQNHIKITLQNEIGTGKIAHAYLFCGPRAVGKTTFARLMAKAVNCLNRKEGEFEPCDKCSSCLE
ncbi:MAG TPA: DNA polymerase III subunit gamma/tau, partial [Candidatus Nanoarchaeia archaeon]|nr:DNA polymerase III subunit gamma/tau [Candidatus Nanoarchaeia archaeon]